MLAATTSLRCATRVVSRRSAVATGNMLQQRRNYHENIVEHYENPRNVGSMDKKDGNVGTVSDLFCGRWVWDGDETNRCHFGFWLVSTIPLHRWRTLYLFPPSQHLVLS